MWGDIAIAFILAFITSFVVVPYTIKLAHKVGAIDIPKDERRMNSKPIPRIGGIAVIVGFLVASIFLIVTSIIENKIHATDFDYYKLRLLGFLGGIAIIAIAASRDADMVSKQVVAEIEEKHQRLLDVNKDLISKLSSFFSSQISADKEDIVDSPSSHIFGAKKSSKTLLIG